MNTCRHGACTAQLRTPRPVTVQALLVPASTDRRCEVMVIALTAAAISDALGGGLLDESTHGPAGTDPFTIYLDDDRHPKGLPANDRATALAAALAPDQQAWPPPLHGDALFVGHDECFDDDLDVPAAVLDAARHLGLLVTPPPTTGYTRTP